MNILYTMVWALSADVNYYSYCGQNGFFTNKNINTYCHLGTVLETSVSESESTASGASILMTSKTLTIQYKPVTSLAGNNNAFAHYEQSPGCEQMSHHEYSLLALSDVIIRIQFGPG